MDEKDYCKLVFLGLVNLLSLLFSIIFTISAFNIKSKKKMHNDKCFYNENLENIINKNYNVTAALFSFHVICFYFFIFFIVLYYFVEKDENKIIRFQNNNQPLENENEESDRNMNENKCEKNKIEPRHLMLLMILSLILCQLFYLIELILVPVLYYKIEGIDNDNCKEVYKKNFLNNYRDLIIVGYIFFFFFFLFI